MEKFFRGPGGLFGNVDLALLQALQQLLGREIDQGDVRRQVEHGVGYRFPHGDAGDLGDDVDDAFEVLDIDGGIDMDAGSQQFLDILPSFWVSAAGGVAMGEFVDQNETGLAPKSRVEVELFQQYPLVCTAYPGQNLHALEQGIGLRSAVRFNVTGHHLPSLGLLLAGGLEHGVGLADTGAIAEKDLQPSPVFLGLFAVGGLEHGLGRGALFFPRVIHGRLPSRARLRVRTLTRGMPSTPS